MAEALAPWFLCYVLSIAETYGANISNMPVPSNSKEKKVQIAEASSHNTQSTQVLLAYTGIL